MMAWKTEGTALYQQLPEQCIKTLKPCKPLRKISKKHSAQKTVYQPWKKQNKS